MKKVIKAISLLLAAVSLFMLFSGCGGINSKMEDTEAAPEATSTETQQAEPVQTETADDKSSDYDGKLVFDRTMQLSYTTRFKVDYYKGGYKLLTIYNRQEDVLEGYIPKTSKFLLVPEGMSVPDDLDGDVTVLQAPISNLLVASNGAVSQLNAVGALDAVSMVTTEEKSWYIDEVKAAMNAGRIIYIGSYKEPEYETVISSKPQLAIYSTM